MDPPIKLSIDQSSIVGLKAELLKKQEEFRFKKATQSQNPISENSYEINKTNSTWGKKKPETVKVEENKTNAADQSSNTEMSETDHNLFEQSRKMLESKAKYYEQVVSGKKMTDDGDEEIFLVDFDRKVEQEEIEVSSETNKKNLRLKSEIDEDQYNEQKRQKWDQVSRDNIEKDAVRYQDIKYDEIRNMGVGNFQFSRDEIERKKQMDFFKEIEADIKTNRISNEIYKLKREKLLLERLNRVKQRRLLKHGYPSDKIKELCKFDEEIELVDQEIQVLEIALQNPEPIKQENETSDEQSDQKSAAFDKKRPLFDREWDKPKLKEKTWEQHVKKLRSERHKLFAPPKIYEVKKEKKQNVKSKTEQSESKKKTEPKIKIEREQSDYYYDQYQYGNQANMFMPPPLPMMFQMPFGQFPMPFPFPFFPPPPMMPNYQGNFQFDSSIFNANAVPKSE